MPELVAENLAKRLGENEVLRGVSLRLERGEILALLGPSGSGKTTLLRSVAGLERPDRGRIAIGGKAIFDADANLEIPAERRGLGLVFQSYAVWPHRTVFENVAYGLKLRRVPNREIKTKVEGMLERLGIKNLAARYPHQLSGGQQQRVALARALAYGPPVLLLDEPLSNLDAKLREEARHWIRQIIKETRSAALYVTHDQTEALAIADRIMVLDQGIVQQEGTPEDIYARPGCSFVAEFMGSNNRIACTIAESDGRRARIAGDGWSLWGALRGAKKPGDAAVGVVRVESLRLTDGGGDNRVRMLLKSASYLGERWEYLFTLPGLELRVWGERALPPGDYWVAVPSDALWLF
ncbi:MAG TPA: ABC transporter ATP-binding protein [Candidatus Binatia bacterium]|jgi:iron(III) transport system ATP-binding protein